LKSISKLMLFTLVACPILALLATVGIHIPFLTQFIGFVYITIVPGIIILRILRVHKLGLVNTLLYSAGLSLAFQMFLGFFINLLYPHISISRPISTLPLVITWTGVLCLLCFIAFRRDKDPFITNSFKTAELLSPPVLLLILLPILAVLAGELVRLYQSNIVLIILYCLIAFIPALAIAGKLIPKTLYPLAIYSIALSLLWSFSLVSKYLIQWDSFLEYYFYGLVNKSGFWNWVVPNDYNAMLSITILPAISSQLLDMSGTAIFKLIYPLWYALVPLCLYQIYSKYYSNQHAFLAAYLFMSINSFFLSMPAIGRQMVAELFCVLLIILVTDREVTVSKKALFIIFGASLVVSHYSLSYLYITFLFLCLGGLYLFRERRFFVTAGSVALFFSVLLSWYMYMSSSAPLSYLSNIGKPIYQHFITELLNPSSRDFSAIFMSTSPDTLHLINRILWYLVLFFMALGAVTLISPLKQRGSPKEYAMLAICSYILLGFCIVIPFFSNALGAERMLHIASLILAPFCISGIVLFFRGLSSAFKRFRYFQFQTDTRIVATVIVVLFFLFACGLPFEIAGGGIVGPLPLAIGHIVSGDQSFALDKVIDFRSSSPTEQEVTSAEWLNSRRNEEWRTYATHWLIGVPVLNSYGMIPYEQTPQLTPLTTMEDIGGSYIYLGYVNVVLGYGTTRVWLGHPDPLLGNIKHWDISKIYPLLDSSMRVYTNGASEIYWSP
jgi:uncharacterized membrane protein